MILARCQGQDIFAIAQNDKAGFFAEQTFFNDHPCTGRTERAVAEHCIDRIVGLLECFGDHDAFTCGETIGLDDNRCALRINITMCRDWVCERLIDGGRNLVTHHELFRKVFGAFQLCGRFGWPKNLETVTTEHIDNAFCQRRFGANHCERDPVLFNKSGECFRFGDIKVGCVRHQGCPTVTWRNIHVFDAGRLQ